MTYGNFAYCSAAFGGDIPAAITCGTPSANLIVMALQQLLELGYTYEEALRLINLMN